MLFRQTKFIFITSFISLLSYSGVLFADSFSIKPYLGADIGLRRMSWETGLGDNVYKHGACQSNLYLGLKFNPYLGAELGHEQIFSKKRDVNFPTNNTVIIVNWDYDGPLLTQSSVKLKGWHLDMVGFYPIPSWNNLELLGAVGVAKIKTRQQVVIYDPLGEDGIESVAYTFSKKKVMPRFFTGFQYTISENFKLRVVLIGIENTSSLDLGPALETPGGIARTKMKSNTFHSIGMLVTF